MNLKKLKKERIQNIPLISLTKLMLKLSKYLLIYFIDKFKEPKEQKLETIHSSFTHISFKIRLI